MSHETLKSAPQYESNRETLEANSPKHHEKLRHNLEMAETKHKEKHKTVEHIQREAIEKASSAKRTEKSEQSPAQKRNNLFTKQQREASFDRQMQSIQAEMRPSQRRFSKIIHNKAIEETSSVLGATIARSNALLAGSISAFLVVTTVYLIAKNYGYPLSGFETIGAFVLGWILGLTYDYVRVLVSGKR